VVSTTQTDPEWANTTVIAQDPIEVIRDLRRQPGADIVQYGFGPLAHALMAEGLLDELRLWVHPFFTGTGNASELIYRAGSAGMFAHADTTALDNGIVILTYHAKTALRQGRVACLQQDATAIPRISRDEAKEMPWTTTAWSNA
jgi:dihydrofolate reductase